jgi:hypothetical protein
LVADATELDPEVEGVTVAQVEDQHLEHHLRRHHVERRDEPRDLVDEASVPRCEERIGGFVCVHDQPALVDAHRIHCGGCRLSRRLALRRQGVRPGLRGHQTRRIARRRLERTQVSGAGEAVQEFGKFQSTPVSDREDTKRLAARRPGRGIEEFQELKDLVEVGAQVRELDRVGPPERRRPTRRVSTSPS